MKAIHSGSLFILGSRQQKSLARDIRPDLFPISGKIPLLCKGTLDKRDYIANRNWQHPIMLWGAGICCPLRATLYPAPAPLEARGFQRRRTRRVGSELKRSPRSATTGGCNGDWLRVCTRFPVPLRNQSVSPHALMPDLCGFRAYPARLEVSTFSAYTTPSRLTATQYPVEYILRHRMSLSVSSKAAPTSSINSSPGLSRALIGAVTE